MKCNCMACRGFRAMNYLLATIVVVAVIVILVNHIPWNL